MKYQLGQRVKATAFVHAPSLTPPGTPGTVEDVEIVTDGLRPMVLIRWDNTPARVVWCYEREVEANA